MTEEVNGAAPEGEEKGKEQPRIGVFVCDCGLNIAGSVDTEKVAKYAEGQDRRARPQPGGRRVLLP